MDKFRETIWETAKSFPDKAPNLNAVYQMIEDLDDLKGTVCDSLVCKKFDVWEFLQYAKMSPMTKRIQKVSAINKV